MRQLPTRMTPRGATTTRLSRCGGKRKGESNLAVAPPAGFVAVARLIAASRFLPQRRCPALLGAPRGGKAWTSIDYIDAPAEK